MHRFWLIAIALAAPQWAFAQTFPMKFDFGTGPAAEGWVKVRPDTLYKAETGYGWEKDYRLQGIAREGDPLKGDFVTSSGLFLFSAKVPEGNYKVTVTLGDAQEATTTTVKSETRRLSLERVHTAAGEFAERSFAVNVRGPEVPGWGKVVLDNREANPETGEILMLHWDDKLTLQFSDGRPAPCAVQIEPIADAITIFLCGDSTVTDQVREPYGTWGMALPRWFKPTVAVANHAESGETVRAFHFEKRWAKVKSQLKAGDYVFFQFGHNDRNQRGRNAMWPIELPGGDWAFSYSDPNTDYKRLLAAYAAQTKEAGATPVIVSSMTNITIGTGELNPAGLGEYPKAAMEAAVEAGAVAIDLNAVSRDLMTALGTEQAKLAYVDGLHSNAYGGYLFSRCIVEGIKQKLPELAKHLADDAGEFDPKNPMPLPAGFSVPREPSPPRGFGGRRGRGGRGARGG